MDLRKVKKLIELLEASQLSELEITEGEESIRISRNAPMVVPAAAAYAPQPAAPNAMPASAEAASTAPPNLGHAIESPTVGTFFSRPGPDSPPFVAVGDTVAVGTTLCVVEAMKTFNEIQSDKDGTVVKILKADGDPVEFGEPLFIVN